MTRNPYKLLELNIILLDVEPTVWRRVLVPDHICFGQLADVITTAMGWSGSHLHQFEAGQSVIGDYRDLESRPKTLSELDTSLHEIIDSRRKTFKFWYDFGDDWWHDITVEKRVPDDGLGIRILDGEHACPPEDCGGPPGYAEMLKVLADTSHPEHESTKQWLGRRPFDPTRFVLEETQKALDEAMGLNLRGK
ncbi:MAG: plasmid pRiA4b ORF-3 family protein [Methylococcaceae bacterium]